MLKHLPVIALAFCCASCGRASLSCDPPDAASIAAVTDPKGQLRSMLLAIAPRTQTGAMVAGKDPAGFNNRLVKSVERAVERHATAWESNLAAAYREGLTSEELSIACDAMKRGDRAAFAPLGEKAGKAMEARSTEFLNQIGGEVLAEMWSEVAHR